MKRLLSVLVLLVFASLFFAGGVISTDVSKSAELITEVKKYEITETNVDAPIKMDSDNISQIKSDELQIKIRELEKTEDKKEWFIEYKNLMNEYSEWCDPMETIYDYYTYEEIILMQKVIETETYDCDFMAKCNVANVILNRLNCTDNSYKGFVGKTVKDIITMENQFCYGRDNITEDTILALEYSFMIEDTTNGALFFKSGEKLNYFYANYIFSDHVNHHFYG